jgi:electron transfer flavoprotein beta subunit
MPNVIACTKWVVDEADLRVGPGGALSSEQAGRKISEYDRNALEEAVRITEKHGGEVVALSVGGPEIKASAKELLSRGAARAVLVMDPALAGADSHTTALALAASVRREESFDLVLCGEGSGDVYAQQVGPRLAALLDVPCISFVNDITVTPTGVVAQRKLEDGVEVVEARFPVVCTLLPEINKPRIPGLKQVMGAAKKPQVARSAADLGLGPADLANRFETRAVRAPTSERRKLRVGGVAELAAQIAAAVR